MLKLFKDRNFALFWFGEMVSVVGDHISLLAFPWLVLQMTNSAVLMGLVFAAQGLPRALLILTGGALVDRTSPRLVMIVTHVLRMTLMLLLAYLISHDSVDIAMVFVMALAFGLADAFFYPASTSILPSLVSRDQLQAGNAIVQTTLHLGMTLGPVLAGLIIAGEISASSHTSATSMPIDSLSGYERDREGLARAFLVDGITFALSLVTLFFVKARKLAADKQQDNSTSLFAEVRQMVAWVWSIPAMRLGFIGIAVIHCFFMPMIYVGLPVLANQRFVEGAYIYGLEVGAYGVGALIGAVLSAYIAGPREEKLIPRMFLLYIFSSSTLTWVILYDPYWWAMLLFFVSGVFDSFLYVHFTTWLQRTSPEEILGRVMSLLMFMSVGLVPIADALMGFAVDWNLEITMIGSSVFLMLFCALVAAHPQSRIVKPQQAANRQ